MTGGHGEWFVQGFDPHGNTTRPLASLRPDEAAATTFEELVAGTQAQSLVSARGAGRAMEIWPDARAFPLLPPQSILEKLHPLYGRAPDAKLPARQA